MPLLHDAKMLFSSNINELKMTANPGWPFEFGHFQANSTRRFSINSTEPHNPTALKEANLNCSHNRKTCYFEAHYKPVDHCLSLRFDKITSLFNLQYTWCMMQSQFREARCDSLLLRHIHESTCCDTFKQKRVYASQ